MCIRDRTLTVRLHPLANQSSDDAVRHLCAELNRTELLFPGTELRLVYELLSSHNRSDQEVWTYAERRRDPRGSAPSLRESALSASALNTPSMTAQ